ncbi:hypothetical protein HMPREF1991_03257 [Hoylesella loescheii DSM 19665 = JCM 12249 = ATCC 15930]|uniref:Uncharacterized protein n=1 Tax=Hoylesella loescheii DSM 19665 = JCM 12249 = ATCC 15930 TaxID=1122985 RepID=A0A069QLJ3_HOYLO|nr:hypothetical protein HMPREF1991_03257 [Hoylesella loescheii DSM 19665 = JCM 12249 = ATCC 15930]
MCSILDLFSHISDKRWLCGRYLYLLVYTAFLFFPYAQKYTLFL